MAIVQGENYQKMYVNEPKELGAAGLQHTKTRNLMDFVTAANAADEIYIGQIPDEAIIVAAEIVGAATAVTLEDADGNAIAIGDKVDPRQDIVVVPAAGVANAYVRVQYVQC